MLGYDFYSRMSLWSIWLESLIFFVGGRGRLIASQLSSSSPPSLNYCREGIFPLLEIEEEYLCFFSKVAGLLYLPSIRISNETHARVCSCRNRFATLSSFSRGQIRIKIQDSNFRQTCDCKILMLLQNFREVLKISRRNQCERNSPNLLLWWSWKVIIILHVPYFKTKISSNHRYAVDIQFNNNIQYMYSMSCCNPWLFSTRIESGAEF